MGEEQRREPRVAHAFMVRYRASDPGGPTWLLSPLKDISRGGARFVSESAFAEGVMLDLQLLLPTADAPVAVAGRIAWKQPGPVQLHEYGVTFAVDDPAKQQAIDAAVHHFLKRKDA